MKTLDYYKKRKQEVEQEHAKLAGTLAALRQERAAMEDQINAAIDADNLADVENLTAKETSLDNRIRATEKILERKKATDGVKADHAELITANNAEMKKYQDDCSAAMKAALKYHRQYIENLLKAAQIVQEANAIRDEYLQLDVVKNDTGSFDYVSAGFGGRLSVFDESVLKEINPEANVLQIRLLA